MIKLLLVGTIVILCGLLGWEINKRRVLEDSHAREVSMLMDGLNACGGYLYQNPNNPPLKLIIPKSEGTEGIRIEGNVLLPPPTPAGKPREE